MKKFFITTLLLIFSFSCLCACGESQYEQDLESGTEKFFNGDFDSMTEEETEAVNNYLEWYYEEY